MRAFRQATAFGIMLVMFMCVSIFAQTEICNLWVNACPESFDNRVITVPPKVVALSATMDACEMVDTLKRGTPPAIMFVIDHSGSMTMQGGHDINGNRFRVTKAIIDSIYAIYPDAEIGFVLFDGGLTLSNDISDTVDSRLIRDPNLVPFGGTKPASSLFNGSVVRDNGSSQAYLPLKKLNETAKADARGYLDANTPVEERTFINLYRSMFHIPSSLNARAGVRSRVDRPDSLLREGSGTNISVGFEAAKEAFQATKISKENQYIIFLSDGDPSPVVSSPTTENCTGFCQSQFDFVLGKDLPTTYTVFLNSAGRRSNLPVILDTVSSIARNRAYNQSTMERTVYTLLGIDSATVSPDSLIAGMTYNIRNNKYSEKNPSSDIWVMTSNYNTMLTHMMDNIVASIIVPVDGAPKKMVIKNTDIGEQSTYYDNGVFTFTRPLALGFGESTEIEMGITYEITVVEKDSQGKDSLVVTDSTHSFTFTIVRGNANANPVVKDTIEMRDCRDKPEIELHYKGAAVDTVKDFMNTLKVVLYDNGNNYSSVTVEIRNADGTVSDTLTLDLVRSGNEWTADFSRVIAAMADKADKILQHTSEDDIIVFFRNPLIPLDTAKIVVPFKSTFMTMKLYESRGNPSALNALPESSSGVMLETVVAGEHKRIFANVFDVNSSWINPQVNTELWSKLKITWSVSEPATVSPALGDSIAFYAERAHVIYTLTATLTYEEANFTTSVSVLIKVGPGEPHHLYIVRDTLKMESIDSVTLEKDKPTVTVWVVERDRFENFVQVSRGAVWPYNGKLVNIDVIGNGSALIKMNEGTGDINAVATRGNLIPDTLRVNVIGESSIVAGPNPFTPGKSTLSELPPAVIQYYEEIINAYGGKGKSGILVAVESPRPLKSGTVRVTIYDAVGNVVLSTLSNTNAKLSGSNTYGYVWEGKNRRGRMVGPGTYLMVITGVMDNGEKFTAPSKKVGVSKAKK